VAPSSVAVVKILRDGPPLGSSPTVSIGAPASSPEGTAINLTSNVTGTSPFTYSWTVMRDGISVASGAAASLSFTPDDNGTYAVTLTVTDKDGGAGSAATSIIVSNVAPAASINGAPDSGVVGTPISLTSSVSDPSPIDTGAPFTYAWSVTKNGGPFTTDTTT